MKLRKRTIVAFLAPAMIAYVMIFLYPVFRTAAMSFFDTKSISNSRLDICWRQQLYRVVPTAHLRAING